ncbi:type I-E CRISPR-associated protein Cse2/CasB [Streptomyces sp. NPDC093094]|uniref:type I-E CRISPR-associated protein Cse2/CasB n=1 Tax=Streptomyces sp. NPDC093094 TaxID=3366026 RepID=UPI00382AA71A
MTTLSTPGSAKQSSNGVTERVARLAAARVSSWQDGYLRDQPAAVAALARLRRGAGRDAAALPDLWGLVDTSPLHTPDQGTRPLSEQQLVRAENALYTALTLWALHQQSRGTRMHRPHSAALPGGLGSAIRRLMPAGEIDDAVRKRLVRAGTAPALTTLAQRLRDIVTLLRGADISLDYGLLAGQLYAWQWPDGPATVRRAWGRSFHTLPRTAPDPDGSGSNPPLAKDDKDAS